MEIKTRLQELADRSYQGAQFTFTDFLSVAELSDFYTMERELGFAHPTVYGGYEGAERAMVRFGSMEELGYEEEFPIAVLAVRPLAKKFADDLNHRDFLGALMNLGIKREMLGDIIVRDKEAYVFCKDSMADFIIEGLGKVKHTVVKVVRVQVAGNESDEYGAESRDTASGTHGSKSSDIIDLSEFAPKLEEKIINIPSARIDAVISRVYKMSRQEALSLFVEGLVYLNGRICTENAKQVAAGDVIAVRGYGKFAYDEVKGQSKKGNLVVLVKLYV